MNQQPQPGDLSHYLASVSPAERELGRLFFRFEPVTIFDIGGCEGEESIRYARAFPRAKIYTFEPLPENQNLIRQNFARYGVSTAEVVDLALSDRSATAEFHVSSGRPPTPSQGEQWNYGNKSSSLLPPANSDRMYGWLEFKNTIKVQTETLDAFVASRAIERVDFLHMDVQGAEHLVLSGARATLPRVVAVWLEVSTRELYRGQQLRPAIEKLMTSFGFVKTIELQREIEGDQFYVNAHRLRTLPYRVARRIVKRLRGGPSAPSQ